MISRLRQWTRPYARTVALAVVLQLVQALGLLLLPTLNADVIDNGVLAGDTDHTSAWAR
ncbi:hypothetical protein CLV68_1911 [Actinokineospora cianjurensis]|uniref:ABC transporter ATP-binding protein n=2 Tax=Actinokineospora cianjurensis TaxID=585224 RepID=A0A421B9Z1_9PSEU|nr:hypothetical protein CLV68_1911 [Actinokineospora cianjurensis]